MFSPLSRNQAAAAEVDWSENVAVRGGGREVDEGGN